MTFVMEIFALLWSVFGFRGYNNSKIACCVSRETLLNIGF